MSRLKANISVSTLTLGKVMQLAGANLSRISPEVLEEPLLKRLGLTVKPAQERIANRRMLEFLKDPTGPDAEKKLSLVFDCVESIPSERKSKVAKRVAKKLLDLPEILDPESRKKFTSTLDSVLTHPSAISQEIADEIRKSAPDQTGPKQSNREILTNLLDALAQDDPIRGPENNKGSIVDAVFRDRHNRVRDVVRMGREKFEKMLDQADSKGLPRKKFIPYLVALAASLVIAGISISGGIMVERESNIITIKLKDKTLTLRKEDVNIETLEAVYRQMVKPTNLAVDKAAGEVVGDGPYSIEQIFDVYDFVRKIKNNYKFKRYVPADPERTLKVKRGECKSKSVLLASMLESIGGKTILFWAPADGVGHVYVGVKISKFTNDEQAKKEVRAQIKKRYGSVSKNIFRNITLNKKASGTYLILDPITRRNISPGSFDFSVKIEDELRIEPIPGREGMCPEI
jgi:hypothetical protein